MLPSNLPCILLKKNRCYLLAAHMLAKNLPVISYVVRLTDDQQCSVMH